MRLKSDVGQAPVCLSNNEVIAKVIRNRGNLFDVSVPPSHWPKAMSVLGYDQKPADDNEKTELLVGLSPKLKNRFFVKRNGLVVLSLENLGPTAKVHGEISNIVEDLRSWEKSLREDWPREFTTIKEENTLALPSYSDEEEEEEEEEE